MMELTMDFLRASGNLPRFHGNGFVQLYLDPHKTKRFHVWHPELPGSVCNAQIHDHKFDMESHILLGKICHQIFYGVVDEEGVSEIAELFYQDKMEAQIRHLGIYDIFTMGQIHMSPGSHYTFPARNLHTTTNSGDGLAATLIFKTQEYPSLWPRIVFPAGEVPDMAYGNSNYTEKELWDAIEDAVVQINR